VHLAESLQCPAIVLSDQFLGQARAVIDRPADMHFGATGRELATARAEGYKRYAITDSGVSPMAIPGTAGVAYTADGLEHAERGTPSSQASDHLAQLEKRKRKLAFAECGTHWADIEGDGEFAVITFGSCTGPLREALAAAAAEGVRARLISLRLLAPAQPQRLSAALAGVRKALVVEQNHTGQLYKYLQSECACPCDLSSLHKPGGSQFTPGELHRYLMEWSRA
jgi:2-oxoglutarate ferredoxin oxidoreductase subunit alpha